MKSSLKYTVLALLTVAIFPSCSTTGRLADDQTLYTGVRRETIESVEEGEKVPGSVRSAVKQSLNVKPNNPLISPRVRTPLPIGLWAYNSLYTEKKKGFRAWLYRVFAKQPVVMERDVMPEARVGMVRDILDNHGYFGSSASYEIFPRHNPKKARVGYTVRVAPPWFYSSVRWPAATDILTREIAAMKPASNVKPGAQYNIDTLTRERLRITNAVRGKGYYWFRPDYLEYVADTTRVPYGVDLRMNLASGTPTAALVPYRVGDVSLRIFNARGTGKADSIEVAGAKVWYQKPLKLRRGVIRRAMSLRRGEMATLPAINRMLDNLTRLGVFRYVNLQVTPLDSLRPGDPLDLTVSAAMDIPMRADIEVDLAYKSSSFIGPSLILGLEHNNIFKGGEIFSTRLNGSYEWQTGNTSSGANSTAVNSYEIGLTASLTFPRMLVPRFIARRARRGGATSYSIGADLMNRPKFFRMLSLGFTNTYDFRTSPTVSHSFTPFKMVYNHLLNTTQSFDATMDANPAIKMSFDDQFIPSGSYTFTFDRRFGRLRGDRITVQATFMSAGNVWAGTYSLFGVKGQKLLLGQPFSQFFKETLEVRFYKQVARVNTFAVRFFTGAGHAYGNSQVLPYTEQFYIGGANSIRAYTIRSIGPGGYHAEEGDPYGYFDQTGDMKLELNAEFRFRIAGGLNGALFFDAGNVWLQKNDPERPGGAIGSGNFFDRVATGTGVGLRYDLSFLVIRFDLGVGIHLPYETSRRGYYNIPRFRDGLGYHLAIGYPF